MAASDVTLLVAFVAGLLSFLSPCVLPLVPAYIGQLTVVAVVGRANAIPSRWLAVRHAIAYVLGFGAVFTILGITATFVGGPARRLPAGAPDDRRRPPDRDGPQPGGHPEDPCARPHLASARGRRGGRARRDHRHGRLRDARPEAGPGSAIGWAGASWAAAADSWPRSASASSSPSAGRRASASSSAASSPSRRHRERRCRAGCSCVAYTLGLGVPFILLGVVYDRAPALVRPLVRHGREVSFVGGILVALIGVFMLMDWLSWFARLAPGI